MKIVLASLFLLLLAGCGGGHVISSCPEPDPDPTDACSTSHSQTHGG